LEEFRVRGRKSEDGGRLTVDRRRKAGDLMKIDIVIPVYNEAENIGETLRAIDRNTAGIKDAEFSVNIVYDFPEDNTLPAVSAMVAEIKIPVRYTLNIAGGVVNAIKTGFRVSSGDFVLVTMADMSDDYSILDDMVGLANKGNDIVCPSRYMKGGKLVGGPPVKQFLSRLAGLTMHWFSGIPTHDSTNSYKLYRLSLVKTINIESEGGFEIGTEITVKVFRNGGKIAELPTIWFDREKGKSRFKLFKWIPKYLKWYFYLIKGKRNK